jgi:hypothetical protein
MAVLIQRYDANLAIQTSNDDDEEEEEEEKEKMMILPPSDHLRIPNLLLSGSKTPPEMEDQHYGACYTKPQ